MAENGEGLPGTKRPRASRFAPFVDGGPPPLAPFADGGPFDPFADGGPFDPFANGVGAVGVRASILMALFLNEGTRTDVKLRPTDGRAGQVSPP
jgi:hypothetical protein